MLKTIIIIGLAVPLVGFLAVKFTPLQFVASYFITPKKALQGSIQLLELDDIKYFLYLPKGYDPDNVRIYPVTYHLHGAMPFGWSLGKSIVNTDINLTASMQEKLVAEQGLSPNIIVAPYDGFGLSMWSDSWSGHRRVESDLLEKLIPHIQSNYPVSGKREETTLQGFSMGGFGAMKIGFKYPQRFGKIISWDGAIHSWETISTRRKKIASEMFKTKETFDQNSPWKSSEQYVVQMDSFPMKVFVVEAWVKDYNQNFKAHLEQLHLPFEYIKTDCPHDMNCMMKQEGIAKVYEK